MGNDEGKREESGFYWLLHPTVSQVMFQRLNTTGAGKIRLYFSGMKEAVK